MALVEGIVTGIIRDAATGKIKRSFQHKNHLSDWMLWQYTTDGTNADVFGPYIYITDFPFDATDRQSTTYGSIDQLAVGFTITSVTNTAPVINPKTPGYIQFHNRFNPPPIDRDINAVGLTPNSVVSLNSYVSPSHACVGLSSTCTQTTTETLDVFYRVQFPWVYDPYNDGDTISIDDFSGTQLQASLLWDKSFSSSSYWPDSTVTLYGGRDPRKYPTFRQVRTPIHEAHVGVFSILRNNVYTRNQLNASGDIADLQGQMISHFGYGSADSLGYYISKANPVGATPIQNLFGHGPAATAPFFDSGNLPAGDATVALGGTWTDPDFGKMYRINMTGSGAIGVATYQIWERICFGVIGNTWQNTARLLHSTYFSSSPTYWTYEGFSTQYDNASNTDYAPRWVRYFGSSGTDIGKCISIRTDDLLLLNVAKESGTRFHSSTYGSFAPTDITDYDLDSSGNIYIACRDTGLYKITDPEGSPSITLIDDTTTGLTGTAGPNVYAVGVGRNDKIWILMDGGLFYSDNGGTSWSTATFSFTNISDSNWDRVINMRADIEHADDRIALVYGTPAQPNNDYEICWYDLNSTTTAAGTWVGQSTAGFNSHDHHKYGSDKKYTLIDWLLVSRTQSKFGTTYRPTSGSGAGAMAYFDFGTTSVTETTISEADVAHFDSGTFITDDDGNQSLWAPNDSDLEMRVYKSTDVLQTYDYGDTTANWDNNRTSYASDIGLNKSAGLCHLGGGAMLSNHYYFLLDIGTPFEMTTADGGASENIAWRKYGWNGAAWELDHAGSKTTHGTEDAIVDGLTIQFDDDGGAESYVVDDYYTVGVFDGIWMDGSTEYDHSSYIYYRPLFEDTDIEIALIPGTTAVPDMRWERDYTLNSWQDTSSSLTTNNESIGTNPSYLTPNYSRGGRSTTVVGGPIPTGTITGRYTHLELEFELYGSGSVWNGVNAGQMVCGLSTTAVLGNAITYAGVQYGIHVDGRAETSSEAVEISIVESGVTVYTYPHLIDGAGFRNGQGSAQFRLRLYADGTLEYIMGREAVIYTSTASATASYVCDVALHGPAITGITDMRMRGPEPAGRFFDIGTPGSPGTGRHLVDFLKCDPDQAEFIVDGNVATVIDDNTLQAVPAAGEVVLAPLYGIFKVSDSDVGNTISATYKFMTQEN